MSRVQRFLPVAVVIALVVVGLAWVIGTNGSSKTVTAYFPRTVSIYEGSDVRVLGVPVGTVEQVVPEGTRVKVTMHYDADVEIPMDADAVIVSPSVVGDRYVQLSPVYESGEVLPDNAELTTERTAVPLELDEIYSSLDELTVALGPQGANKEGALTDLLEQTAKNFGGQGARFNQTIKDFGQLSETLDNNKEDLFESVEQLGTFVETLAENDGTVRDFNRSLGDVSKVLSDERQELAEALGALGTALDVVGRFVQDNRKALGGSIKKANRVARVLAKRRAELDETLKIAPLAYNNLGSAYNPQVGTFDTNANIGQIGEIIGDDPALFLCTLLGPQDSNGKLCDLFETILPRNGPFGAGTGSRSGTEYDPTLSGLVVE
jgi:phospholipid/cholesterol/gamma-HCH transport system substrate-binding protein